MKKIDSLIILIALTGCFFSCTNTEALDVESRAVNELYSKRDSLKWLKEDSVRKNNLEDSIAIAQENARLYALYLQDLKSYKESEHPVMFGWFNAWDPASPSAYSQLTLLPDSMDIVSIWGTDKMFALNDQKKEQLREIQAKGTKVIIGWIIENIGDQIDWDKTHWPDEPEAAVKAYAKAICDSVQKYNYDGFDIDYEPSYASPFKPGSHCGDWSTPWEQNKALISCQRDDNKDYENLFFKTMRELLGPDKILNINGSIHWLDPVSAKYFDYFVVQSYNGNYASWTSQVLDRLQSAGVKKKQIIYTESFENKQQNRLNFRRYADFVVNTLNRDAGGIGAYHINEDALDNNNYQQIREAISIMNPSVK
ncbi:MAG: glycoside hydrolase family 18 [Proteiniphilum sp.]|nr:glycoside hydrolase family 18 [Proteiniphilum sp.]MDD4157979.1 glycoside hydrolase family 18 [Proteiniphilum sp.]MDD4799622.1 glycoside hydrolase family 18 [Proteiniphilum sp.]